MKLFARILAILLPLCLLLPVLPAGAREPDLHVGFTAFPPWRTLGPDGARGGIDIEFLREFASRAGLRVILEPVPFKRGLHMMQVGTLDMMVGLLKRPERAEYMHFLGPPYKTESHKAFYVLEKSGVTIDRYEDLYGKVVGTALGARYFPRFDTDERIERSPVTDPLLSFRMLLAGHVDTVVMTETVGDYRLVQAGMVDTVTKAAYTHCEPQEVFLGLSKRSRLSGRLAEFQRILEAMRAEGVHDRIARQYMESLHPVAEESEPRGK